jgi:hypothetical protein
MIVTLHAVLCWGIGRGAAAWPGLAPAAWPAGEPLLALEAKISLGKVSDRMDHFALDEKRGWLFIAELANDSVGVIDLATQTLLRRSEGVEEPLSAWPRCCTCRRRSRRGRSA